MKKLNVVVVSAAVAAMPTFDDVEKILNASGITVDPMMTDSPPASTSASIPGMSLRC